MIITKNKQNGLPAKSVKNIGISESKSYWVYIL